MATGSVRARRRAGRNRNTRPPEGPHLIRSLPEHLKRPMSAHTQPSAGSPVSGSWRAPVAAKRWRAAGEHPRPAPRQTYGTPYVAFNKRADDPFRGQIRRDLAGSTPASAHPPRPANPRQRGDRADWKRHGVASGLRSLCRRRRHQCARRGAAVDGAPRAAGGGRVAGSDRHLCEPHIHQPGAGAAGQRRDRGLGRPQARRGGAWGRWGQLPPGARKLAPIPKRLPACMQAGAAPAAALLPAPGSDHRPGAVPRGPAATVLRPAATQAADGCAGKG